MIYVLYTIIFFSAIEILYFLHKKLPFLNTETLPIMQSLNSSWEPALWGAYHFCTVNSLLVIFLVLSLRLVLIRLVLLILLVLVLLLILLLVLLIFVGHINHLPKTVCPILSFILQFSKFISAFSRSQNILLCISLAPLPLSPLGTLI